MSTTKQEQYSRLRKLLSSSISGKNTDALLWAMANPATYLVDTVEAVNENMFIASASGKYLDQRLADYNLVRPPEVGLSDDVFREIGIEIINRKQVRDLLMRVLGVIFGEELTQSTSKSNQFEPYNLDDGDTLKLQFDGGEIVQVKFEASQFSNINSASAQEIADSITKSLRSQGKTGRAFAKDDGSGGYVVLISDTEGPQSSVVVWGGKAQNQLMFDKVRPTTGGASTQWTLSLVSGGNVRFTWTAGANPSIGKVRIGDYVNIYGSGFDTNNQGTFSVVDLKGGTVGNAYFEIGNPTGIVETVLQGTVDGILFFQPFRHTIITKTRYAAIFQEESRLLEVFIPATTKVVRRERKGASHIHEQNTITTTYDPGLNQITDITIPDPSLIADGSYFFINSANDSVEYLVYADKTGLNSVVPSVPGKTNVRIDLSSAVTAQDAAAQIAIWLNLLDDFSCLVPQGPVIRVCNSSVGLTTASVDVSMGVSVSIFQAGHDLIETTISVPNANESLPDQEGPYIYDPSQPFDLSHIGSVSVSQITPETGRVIQLANASEFPDTQGFLMLSYGTDRQEGPIPYLSRPSSTSLLLNPSYNIVNTHHSGCDVRLVSNNGPVSISKDGSDYPTYLTDVVVGRQYAEDLIKEISATGIRIVITVLYPGDEGLGRYFTEDSEKISIWGGDEDV